MWAFQELDVHLLQSINGFAGHSAVLDTLAFRALDNSIIKGALPVMLLWFLWFQPRAEQQRRRAMLLAAVIISVLAIIIGRAAAVFLPFRLRPIHDAAVATNLPIGLDESALGGWSSFPSDHGVMYFCIATVVFFHVSRGAGLLLYLHALFLVSLPRAYAGFHYPSDLIAGAIIGAAIGLVCAKPVAGYLVPGLRLLR